MTTPKPLVTELPMQIPLCDMDSEKSELEESLIRNANLQADAAEKNMKEIAMKLFAVSGYFSSLFVDSVVHQKIKFPAGLSIGK